MTMKTRNVGWTNILFDLWSNIYKVNSVKEAFDKCFAVHLSKFEIFQTTGKNKNKFCATFLYWVDFTLVGMLNLTFKVLNGLYYMYAILSLINRGKSFARSHVTMTSVAMSICLLSNTWPGVSSLGVPGGAMHPQNLADQLTLSQLGGEQIMPTK